MRWLKCPATFYSVRDGLMFNKNLEKRPKHSTTDWFLFNAVLAQHNNIMFWVKISLFGSFPTQLLTYVTRDAVFALQQVTNLNTNIYKSKQPHQLHSTTAWKRESPDAWFCELLSWKKLYKPLPMRFCFCHLGLLVNSVYLIAAF